MPQTIKKKSNKSSNLLRWVIFTLLLVCFCTMLTSFLSPNKSIEEVPLSEVIARANDENGDIAKITVEGSELKITLKGNDYYTQTSRKDSSGTLYEQGLINQCEGLVGDELSTCVKDHYRANRTGTGGGKQLKLLAIKLMLPVPERKQYVSNPDRR